MSEAVKGVVGRRSVTSRGDFGRCFDYSGFDRPPTFLWNVFSRSGNHVVILEIPLRRIGRQILLGLGRAAEVLLELGQNLGGIVAPQFLLLRVGERLAGESPIRLFEVDHRLGRQLSVRQRDRLIAEGFEHGHQTTRLGVPHALQVVLHRVRDG